MQWSVGERRARPLRLLYVQHASCIGGAERQASLVLPELAGQGVEATAVAGPGGAIVEWFERCGVPSFVWSRHFPESGPFAWRRLPAYLGELARLLTELDALYRARRFDVVLGSLGYGWAVAGLCGRRWGVPAVWRAGGLTLGGTADPGSPEALGVRLLASLLGPALLVCNAQAVRRFWQPLLGLPSVLVPNGVVLPTEAVRRRRRPDDPFVAGYAGRLAPEKGLPVLFEACALARARGVDVQLRLAGPGPVGPLVERLDALGLRRHVEFLGRRHDLTSFYAGCDALVLPSHSEGCSNVLLEAMAHALPPVATTVGGTPEVVRAGVDGLLVPPRSPAALADALVSLARDPVLAAALGAAGRQHVAGQTPAASAEALSRALYAVTARAPRVTRLHLVGAPA